MPLLAHRTSLEWARKHDHDPLAASFTRDLLAFNTINPPGQEEDCARHLGRLLEAAGFSVVITRSNPRAPV